MEKILWAGSSSNISKISGSDTFDHIPQGVWELKTSLMGPYLQKVSDNFHFGHKIYGLEEEFISYSLRSFHAAEKNMGILLNGLKGCGKTVTAKILANRSELPVVIINASNIDVLNYFNNVNQSLCFMFDEFEKIIDHKDTERIAPLLSFVDGTITSAKHFMIFTSNNTDISEFFIDRPGRIRYIKNYGSLAINVVKEILNDKLEHPEFKQAILDWVMFFKFLTIDMLISIINEVNVHATGPDTFKKFFNADNDKPSYDITVIVKEMETGKTVQFECDSTLEYSPADYVENLIDHDSSLRVLGYSAHLHKVTGQLMPFQDNYPRSIYVSNIDSLPEELEENDFRFKGYFQPKDKGLLARIDEKESTKSEDPVYAEVIFNSEKTEFISTDVELEIELKFKARALYKNYHTYAF